MCPQIFIRTPQYQDVTLCCPVDVYRRFGGTYCLHYWESTNRPNKYQQYASKQIISSEISAKFNQNIRRHIFIVNAMGISNPNAADIKFHKIPGLYEWFQTAFR
jgi:hypothetical protein